MATNWLRIPCHEDLTHYRLRTTLDGTTYALEFRWNTREGAWYMSIRSEDGLTDIANSIKVVVGWGLNMRSVDPNRPPGVFLALDTTGKGIDPGIADLGDRVQLYYVPVGALPS